LSCVRRGVPGVWAVVPTVLVERMPGEQVVLDRAPHEWDRPIGKLVERAPPQIVAVSHGARLASPSRAGEEEIDTLAFRRSEMHHTEETQVGRVERDPDLLAALPRRRGGRGLVTGEVAADRAVLSVFEARAVPTREQDRVRPEQEHMGDDR